MSALRPSFFPGVPIGGTTNLVKRVSCTDGKSVVLDFTLNKGFGISVMHMPPGLTDDQKQRIQAILAEKPPAPTAKINVSSEGKS
jgi:hypothetical protein